MRTLFLAFFLLIGIAFGMQVQSHTATLEVQLENYDPSSHTQFLDIVIPDHRYAFKQQLYLRTHRL